MLMLVRLYTVSPNQPLRWKTPNMTLLATITLARKKSTGKPNTTTHISTHCPLAERIGKCDHGIVYVEVAHGSPMLFFARNDTQRNSVSL